MKKLIFYSLLSIVWLVSCKKDYVPENIKHLESDISQKGEKQYLDSLYSLYNDVIEDTILDKNSKMEILDHGSKFFMDYNKGYSSNLIIYSLRKYPDSDNKNRIKSLIEIYKLSGNKELAEIGESLFLEKYPEEKQQNGKKTSDNNSNKIDFKVNLTDYSKKVFNSLETTGKYDLVNAKKFINAVSLYAYINPNNENTVSYLYNAAQMSQMVGMNKRAIDIYDWILDDYPTNDKVSNALFMKGFLLDSELKNYSEAKKCYEEFLVRFPESPLVNDVKNSLKYLGMSDEEVLEKLENASH
ncbi:MAG: hypothetical protein R2771_05255 [Saprospiraceae bacterium]